MAYSAQDFHSAFRVQLDRQMDVPTIHVSFNGVSLDLKVVCGFLHVVSCVEPDCTLQVVIDINIDFTLKSESLTYFDRCIRRGTPGRFALIAAS